MAAEGFYYLETSALIRLSRWIVESANTTRAIAYTSFLSIFEILAGLTEANYSERVAVLRSVAESRLPVDWDTPREAMAESFSEVRVMDGLRHGIQLLLDIARRESSLPRLKILSAQTSGCTPWDELPKMEVVVSTDRSVKVQSQILRMRREVPAEPRKVTRSRLNTTTFRQDLTKVGREVLLADLAAFVAARMPGPKTEESVLKVLTSYNGRADRFLAADALRQGTSLISGQQPARNDFIDVSHLLYIPRADQIIVSDDGLLIRICNELFPENVRSSDQFRRQYA